GQPRIGAEEAARLPGNVRMVEHQHRFDPEATEARLVESLRQAGAGQPIAPDTFVLESRAKPRLEGTRALLAHIEANPQAFADEIRRRIRRYTPPDLSFAVRVYFIVGGTSDGFADGRVFCVALDYFRDDEEGLRTIMAHELFHSAFEAGEKAAEGKKPARQSLSSDAERVLPLLESTMNEGIASRVGDPTKATDGKAWIEWFRSKFNKNFERMGSNFVLFDTILDREYRDPKAPIEELYRIGFSGSYDSALYFVGYEMARVIEEQDGPEALVRVAWSGPVDFFSRYLAISREHPDRVRYRFDAETGSIVAKMARPARGRDTGE
ncbi:MAG: DUF5700 domain-containing putative Zn-dependent protease, partial [Syntrophomonadaceae bacterium]